MGTPPLLIHVQQQHCVKSNNFRAYQGRTWGQKRQANDSFPAGSKTNKHFHHDITISCFAQ